MKSKGPSIKGVTTKSKKLIHSHLVLTDSIPTLVRVDWQNVRTSSPSSHTPFV